MKARADSVLGLHVSSPAHVVSRERQLADVERRIVQLFNQLHQPVQRYVRWIGLSEADADEVAQEAFLRLVEHLRAGRDDEHLRAWVYRGRTQPVGQSDQGTPLRRHGPARLRRPASRFLPTLEGPAANIRVRHLLNHRSGLPPFEDFLGKTPRLNEKTPADVVRAYLAQNLRFNRGDRWEYSNGGYAVLTHVVANVARQPYASFMHERIFGPLKMRNTFFAEEPRLASSPRAIGYFREWYGLKISETLEPLKFYTGQALFMTLDDLYLWDQALYPDRLVGRDTLERAFTGGRLNDGSPLLYGFGWEVYWYKGVRYVIHAGGWAGFKSFILRFPDQRFSVIALSNSNRFDIWKLPLAIARLYIGDRVALPEAIGKAE
jgi:CubicO group peptidase (beta-lactamase class C family)